MKQDQDITLWANLYNFTEETGLSCIGVSKSLHSQYFSPARKIVPNRTILNVKQDLEVHIEYTALDYSAGAR